MTGRLPTSLEVAATIRRVQANGDFAAILHRGDEDRGALLLMVASRGAHIACLERILGPSGDYVWQRTGPPESAGSDQIAHFLAQRARFDEDFWAIELDIADAERFIAETISLG